MRFRAHFGWLPILSLVIIFSGSTLASATNANVATARLPLVFVENRGQAPAQIRYLLHEGSIEEEFETGAVLLKMFGDNKVTAQVKMRLVGAHADAVIAGAGKVEGHTNYLIGNNPALWLRGLPNYTEVRYNHIYTGTDLVFYGNSGSLEHNFELQAGADPNQIGFQLDGAENTAVGKNGDLKITLPGGAIAFSRPIAYQTVAGVRYDVDASFVVDQNGTIRFKLGHYNASEKLVIDPVLTFSTYLSQLASDANVIATDSNGNNYISGFATLGFPVTSGAFAGCADCTTNSVVTFVSKLSADGASLIYSTVLGGNNFAQPTGIAVDANGDAFVSGWTGATDFPTKYGQPILPPDNNYLGFLVSLSPDGSSLNYGTLLSSSPTATHNTMTYATAVAVDSLGNAYVTGETGDGFFISSGALNQAVVGSSYNNFDVFLAKFNPAGTLVYSAVLGTADPQNGGGGPIGASALAVDAAGDAFVAGQAGTLWPISSNAYLKQIAGSMPYATPFVSKVAPDGKSLLYSTYLDYAYVVTGIASLANGNVFITGDYAGPSYPTTSNAYQQNTGLGNAFLTELNSDGSGLTYSTVVGDSSYKINGLTLDPNGNIWLAGQTSSSQFPLVSPVQGTFPSSSYPDPVSTVDEFDPTGQTLKFSSFLGGNAAGYASSVAVDPNAKVHVAGAAQYGMYTTPGVYASSVPNPGPGLSTETYAYVALIDPATAGATLCLGGYGTIGLSFGYLAPQTTASQTVQVTNCGDAPLTFSSFASSNPAFTVPASGNTCTGSLSANSSCNVSVAFTPTAVQSFSGQLTFTSNASIATTSIPLNGSGGAPSAGFGPPGITQSLVFPSELVGQTSAAEFIRLYNNGTVPLTVYPAQISVTTGFELAPGGTCSSSLAAHQSCLIFIQFAPTTAGTINGTLSVSTNDPVNPTISTSLTGTAFSSYPVPTITALLNPSYPVSGSTTPITMLVDGTNFFPVSTVYINGLPQSTTYQGGGSLSVTFSSSLLNAAGQLPVTVVNPAPGGGTSASYPLTVYLSISQTASALTVDPVGGLLYAAIPASASQNPNTVIPINPATGAMMTPIPVATNPQKLAISDDGAELYVASTGVLQRINLKTLAIEKTFNLPVDSEWGQTYVQEMHVVPGSPQSIVVELFAKVDPAEDGAALYNDSGLVNWIPGQSVVNGANSIFWLDSFTFASSPSIIYGLPVAVNNTFFTEVQVSSTGLSWIGIGTAGEISEQTGSMVRSDGTLLYTNSGQVWDPSTQKLLGTYLESNGSQLFYTAGVVPDTANGHTYFLDNGGQYDQYQAVNIDVYDQSTYALLGTVPFTTIYPPDVADLVRWGSNGFAFRSVDITGAQPSADQIVIVTSNLIPSAAPAPLLSSVSPAQVYAGGPAYTMQLTGSGFTSASTVFINGNPRSTTYVNSTSLACQVSASDIATVGQLAIQVTTPAPGGGTSKEVDVPIQALPATPTLSVVPSATTLTTAETLTVTVAVSGTSGASIPTGTVTLSSGGYASTATTLSGGGATIVVPAGSLPVGTDTLTASYSGDSNYNATTGTASVTVNVPPSFTLSASPATLSVAQGGSGTSTISVAGVGGFSGTVALSASGLPSGVTASFAAGASAGTQLLTLTASTSAAVTANPITVTITGTSGSLSATTTVSLSVTAEPSFTAGSGGTTSLTVSPGSTTGNTATINVVGTNGFSGTVNLTCNVTTSLTNVNDMPRCSLNPASLSISGGTAQTSLLTVMTTAASSAENQKKKMFWPSAGGTTLALILLFVRPRKPSSRQIMLGFVILLAFTGIVACGGGSSGTGGGGEGNLGTTPGAYTITVTGTSGSINATVGSVALTVQ